MGNTTPLHYEIRDTPLFGAEPRRVIRYGRVYLQYPEPCRVEPQVAADEAVNRLKIGMETEAQRRAVETLRPIIEAECGVRPVRGL